MATVDFSRIDFNDETVNKTKNRMVIKIKNNKVGTITQTPIYVDRCCTPFKIEPDITSIKDNIPRAQCNISKADFLSEYVHKRKAVMLVGCQKNWPARKWTFEGSVFPMHRYCANH